MVTIYITEGTPSDVYWALRGGLPSLPTAEIHRVLKAKPCAVGELPLPEARALVQQWAARGVHGKLIFPDGSEEAFLAVVQHPRSVTLRTANPPWPSPRPRKRTHDLP